MQRRLIWNVEKVYTASFFTLSNTSLDTCFSPESYLNYAFNNTFYELRTKSQSTWNLYKQWLKKHYEVCKDNSLHDDRTYLHISHLIGHQFPNFVWNLILCKQKIENNLFPF